MAAKKTNKASKTSPAEKKPAATKKPKEAKNIREALFNFQAEKLVLPRNGEGKTINGKVYKYVTLDDMIKIAGPVLQKYGIGFSQLVQTDKMETKLFHAASDTELESVINLGSPNNMQDYGGRITYAKRYALGAILGLSSEEDVDASPIPAEKTTPAAQTVAEPKGPEKEATKPLPDTHTEKSTLPDTHQVARSESFAKTKNAIDTAFSSEALELISGQIERSSRLTEGEKVELKDLLKARDTEVSGTIHH